jgi:heme-degrading monooxygenase HmoA
MVGQRAQRRVLRHRQASRAQRGVGAPSQRLLNALHQIPRTEFDFRLRHDRNLTSRYAELCKEPDTEEIMTTIVEHAPYATLINVFTVSPGKAAELAALLTDSTEAVMQQLPGFRSANIHISTDGTRVVNYAQWDSAEAFAAMQANPEAQVHMRAAAELADGFDPHLYTVESVHQR